MRFLFVLTLLFLFSFAYKELEDEPIWSDEFNGNSIDLTNWKINLGNGCPSMCGFGNNELQTYTDHNNNVRVEDGKLIIEVHANDSLKYTSAKIQTVNSWKYGTIEVRAKLPKGRGTWPAIWMLPTNWKYGNWPKSGEIDIMEHVGYDQDKIHGTVHTESFNHLLGTQKGKTKEIDNVSDTFHTYSIQWTEEDISFYIDNVKYNQFKNSGKGSEEWPFDNPFYLILNIAVGGNWGGKKGVDDTIWPQRMEIDYVKVYK